MLCILWHLFFLQHFRPAERFGRGFLSPMLSVEYIWRKFEFFLFHCFKIEMSISEIRIKINKKISNSKFTAWSFTLHQTLLTFIIFIFLKLKKKKEKKIFVYSMWLLWIKKKQKKLGKRRNNKKKIFFFYFKTSRPLNHGVRQRHRLAGHQRAKALVQAERELHQGGPHATAGAAASTPLAQAEFHSICQFY